MLVFSKNSKIIANKTKNRSPWKNVTLNEKVNRREVKSNLEVISEQSRQNMFGG